MTLNVLSLFAGIGGLELGLERAGMTVVGQVELDDYCQRVLAKHWPDVPRHDDVRTAAGWWQSTERPRVDVVCGGFPCQPVSLSGRGLAQQDPRWLWPAMRDVIDAVRPTWVVGENVIGLRTRGLDGITADLADLGYDVETRAASACAVGAPQMRRRLFIVANTAGVRRWTGLREGTTRPEAGTLDLAVAADRPTWPAEPALPRVANGLPDWVDRRRALGNAVVPRVAEHVGRLIVAHHEASVAA